MKKERMIGLDVLKIVCAFLIFGRHAVRSGGCTFSFLSNNIDNLIIGFTVPVMTAFFIMSGFAIQYAYGRRELFIQNNLQNYYFKRFLSLFPMYFFVHIVSSFFYGNEFGVAVRLFPVEILGLQTWFEGLFNYLHNGGTWFVSCLLIAYFIYPIVGYIIKSMKIKGRVILLSILVFIRIYSTYIISFFGMVDDYDSVVFRTLEFMIGVILCSVIQLRKEKIPIWGSIVLTLISGALLCKLCVNQGKFREGFSCVFIIIIIYAMSHITEKATDKSAIMNLVVNVIKYGGSLCYSFYILQCIIWKPFNAICVRFPVFEQNKYRLFLLFGMLMGASIALHELYEKPVKNYMVKIFEKYHKKSND